MSAIDLSLAKESLFKMGLTLVAAKDGKILFRSKSHGVSDLLMMIEDIGKRAEGSSVADSVVGRAAALLCVYSKTIAVFGARMSEGAVSILKANAIHYEFGTLVPRILNREKSDICPFDKALIEIEDPAKALEKLKSLKFM
jgi:hypothetical protein